MHIYVKHICANEISSYFKKITWGKSDSNIDNSYKNECTFQPMWSLGNKVKVIFDYPQSISQVYMSKLEAWFFGKKHSCSMAYKQYFGDMAT